MNKGSEDTHTTQTTDFTLYFPHMEYAHETWWKDMKKGGLFHVPWEPPFKKHTPVTSISCSVSQKINSENAQLCARL